MTTRASKPAGRTRDPELLASLHLRWEECALCWATRYSAGRLELHHISNKPREDVEANLVMLCTGCHGLITAEDAGKKAELALYLRESRPDALAYLDAVFPLEGAHYWLQRVLGG